MKPTPQASNSRNGSNKPCRLGNTMSSLSGRWALRGLLMSDMIAVLGLHAFLPDAPLRLSPLHTAHPGHPAAVRRRDSQAAYRTSCGALSHRLRRWLLLSYNGVSSGSDTAFVASAQRVFQA